MSDTPIDDERPTGAKAVGSRLRKLRKDRGITGSELADRVGVSQSKISRIETGAVSPDPADVERIALALEEDPDAAARLREIAEQPASSAAAARVGARQSLYREYESLATAIRVFQPAVVPGLLQTSAYAKALFLGYANLFGLSYADQGGAKAVADRMARQGVLYEKKNFVFVLLESVLTQPVASASVMLSQIETLEQLSELPNVKVMIVPFGRRILVAPLSPVEIFDDQAAFAETNLEIVQHTDPDEVSFQRRLFDHIEALATDQIIPILRAHHRRYAKRVNEEAEAKP